MDSISGLYHYHRIGHDERELELLPDGRIGRGADGAEQRWRLRPDNGHEHLLIEGDYGDICSLRLESDGAWRGRWLQYERMPVELIPRRLQPFRSLASVGVVDRVPNRFHYVSYAELVRDCHELARRLPPVRAIAGIPRSGLVPASILALELNVPMVSLESLCDSDSPPVIPLPRRGYGRRVGDGIILIVDDTCASGRQIRALQERIRGPVPVEFAAIYVEDRPTIAADHFHSKLPPFAQFYEWTMFHDDNNRRILTDMDGVLCEDWQGGDEQERLGEYEEFLAQVRPRRIPSMPLKGIVTNRLERHRPETEAWLQRHGIRYESLVMSPHATFAARDKADDGAQRKAAAYLADPSALLFVESDEHQARQIAQLTGRPVLAVDRNRLI